MNYKDLISTNIIPLKQVTNKLMFIGSLRVEEIVSVIRYTDRKLVTIDPIENDNIDQRVFDQQYYQRIKDSDRTYNIKLFILKQLYNLYSFDQNQISPLALFPSSIILGCNTDDSIRSLDDFRKVIRMNQDEGLSTENVLLYEGKIFISKGESTMIVDGQHRIAGIENLLNESKNGKIILKRTDLEAYQYRIPPVDFIIKTLREFEFLITFLIDFDRYEQAELFANVNFNQKPVNKSFYYDIFGTAHRGKTIEKLLHDLTAHLNYNVNSPLKGQIKMLGSGPGFFSQAFFVEALVPLFRKGPFFSIFVDYQEGGAEYKMLPKFLRSYFSSFFETFSKYYPNSILVKTTGMGAIVALIPFIYNRLKEFTGKQLDLDEKEMQRQIKKILKPISEKGDNYFGPNSGFTSGAGKGLQSRLYKKILSDLQSGEKKKL